MIQTQASRVRRRGKSRSASPPWIRRALAWFDRNARSLPWRTRKSRYRVWISEIMLQQTQVATVIPYFQRFLGRFPSVKSLAAADLSEVLRQWEGLGYYRRARHLHESAREIMVRFHGRCPGTVAEWQSLPGIGRYTASAILSICDDARLPILEANTIRLYCRLFGETGDPQSSATRERLWKHAESLLPMRRVGDFNQALMEIGSLVCTPRDPQCAQCPLIENCVAFRSGQTHVIPRKTPRRDPTRLRQMAVVIQRGDKILLRRSGADERWAGLWDLARFDWPATQSPVHISHQVWKSTGLRVRLGPEKLAMRFGVTRYAIDLRCHQASEVRGRLRPRNGAEWKWISTSELKKLPFNVSARRIVRRLDLESSR